MDFLYEPWSKLLLRALARGYMGYQRATMSEKQGLEVLGSTAGAPIITNIMAPY